MVICEVNVPCRLSYVARELILYKRTSLAISIVLSFVSGSIEEDARSNTMSDLSTERAFAQLVCTGNQ